MPKLCERMREIIFSVKSGVRLKPESTSAKLVIASFESVIDVVAVIAASESESVSAYWIAARVIVLKLSLNLNRQETNNKHKTNSYRIHIN